MTGCLNCGRDCQGARCKLCSVEHAAPGVDDHGSHECPECGGPTSGEDVTCADCRRETARTDGGEQEHGTTNHERDVEDVVNYDVASGHDLEPHAAERVDSGQCEYEDCDSDADYLVEVEKHGDTVGALLCCQDCSSRNRIYAKENDLLDHEVSPEVSR